MGYINLPGNATGVITSNNIRHISRFTSLGRKPDCHGTARLPPLEAKGRKERADKSVCSRSLTSLGLCLIGVFPLLLGFSSCISQAELINFRQADQAPNDSSVKIENATNLTIQPEDLLRIDINSLSEVAGEVFNPPTTGQGNQQMGQGGGQGGNYTLELFMGYLVDQEGFIELPVLGRVLVAGLTLEEAKSNITRQLNEYLKDPVVSMRFLNLKVTVLGEVNFPGVQRLSNKRVTLLEALGMAGDLTAYANRNNIMITREENGQRDRVYLDLQSDDIFSSPYFYLQQNDVIYVEPNQARVATVADPAQRIISYAGAGLSLITLIFALTR